MMTLLRRAGGAGIVRSRHAEETRRINRLAGIYRMLCGLLLLAVIAFLDLRSLAIKTPGAFVSTSLFFFLYGVVSWWWITRQSSLIALKLSALIAIDTLFVALLMETGGPSGSSLAILLIPQLAANAWLIRNRLAFFQSALSSLTLITFDVYRLYDGAVGGAQVFQTGLTGLGYFAASALGLILGRYYGASEEISERRQIDLANLEQVYSLIIQDMQDGVLVVDASGRIRRYNQQLLRMVARNGVTSIDDGEMLDTLSPTLYTWWQQWQFDEMDGTTTMSSDSSSRTFQLRFVPIGSTRRNGALIYVEDLARTQQLAQQLKLAALGRLTASIAHEIRNPLSAVNHAATLLDEDDGIPEDSKRLVGIIRNNAMRIERIVTEVLQINKRDKRSQATIALQPFVGGLVEEICAAEKIAADVMVVQIPRELTIIFDRGHMEQILWNLVRNAWHYSQKKGGSIRIDGHPGYRGDAVILRVVDDGPGVPPEVRAQLFEPFFTTRQGGTGLGLYMARELAEANGATLELTEEHPGAHFRLILKRGIDRLLTVS